MQQALTEQVFGEVDISSELETRPFERADFLREKMAIQDLTARMVTGPEEVLPRFVELALQMSGGTSAGLSLFDPDAMIFRWIHLCGELSAFEGATTPRNYSPCGVTLDRCAPTLIRHPEWAYSWVADAKIVLPEVLLVPLFIGKAEALGTLWVVASDEGHFHGGHARFASELATLVGIALHVKRSEDHLKLALEAQETLTREMNHRVKNVFALTEGLLRQTLRSSATKEEMAEALSGRLHALSSAHWLVLRDNASQQGALDLHSLAAAILAPHGHGDILSIVGEALTCGETVASSIALVLNELATNSAKYGALATDVGRVSVKWDFIGDLFELTWTESGGPPVSAPTRSGFGSKLIETTIVRQFKGSVDYRWQPEGLAVDFKIPASVLR